MGRYATALTPLSEGLAIARQIGDKRMVAAVLQPLGLAAIGNGDPKAARTNFAEALP